MLRRLSGRTHRVHTGVALRAAGAEAVETVTTLVTLVPLTPAMLEWYLGTGEPFGKAGAYAIQGAGGVLVEGREGQRQQRRRPAAGHRRVDAATPLRLATRLTGGFATPCRDERPRVP